MIIKLLYISFLINLYLLFLVYNYKYNPECPLFYNNNTSNKQQSSIISNGSISQLYSDLFDNNHVFLGVDKINDITTPAYS